MGRCLEDETRQIGLNVCIFYILWRVVGEGSSALDTSSGVSYMYHQGLSPGPMSLSMELDHYCFVLWVGRKAVGPMCCVMHVKEPCSS